MRCPLRTLRLATAACLLALLALTAQAQQAVSREPVLLVAHPDLPDPNFAQTVVLVVFPRDGGPTGLILNQPTRLKWKDAFPDLPALARRTDPIFFGGPVRMTGLWYMLREQQPPQAALPVLDDLYVSADGRFLEDGLARGLKVERFFLGYAGWTPEQLELEIARGAWYVLPADLKSILDLPHEKMWRELLRRATAVEA
jgi:putative transcriptional regulator